MKILATIMNNIQEKITVISVIDGWISVSMEQVILS
jgi:hypothetical protein